MSLGPHYLMVSLSLGAIMYEDYKPGGLAPSPNGSLFSSASRSHLLNYKVASSERLLVVFYQVLWALIVRATPSTSGYITPQDDERVTSPYKMMSGLSRPIEDDEDVKTRG